MNLHNNNPKLNLILTLLFMSVNNIDYIWKVSYMIKRKYGIGLDIGIGSVGFAVLSWTNDEDTRIETLGARLFDSGENRKRTATLSQERRMKRAHRRLLRRRKHRKDRVKFFLQKIGLISKEKLQAWQEVNGNQNVLQIRLKGLTEKLTPEEIADCIIHICNHRGYREFYEDEEAKEPKQSLKQEDCCDENIVEEDKSDKDEKKIKTGLSDFEKCYHEGGYKSVADMLLHDELFHTDTAFVSYHNHDDISRYILIKRKYVREELLAIMHRQQEFYPQLTDENIEFLCDKIIFAQRDFETGPGNPDDKDRKFMGFLDTLGKCMFYKTEDRAFRSTVLADIYSLVNCLSQMAFVDTSTGEIMLPKEAAAEIIDTALINGTMTENTLKKLLQKYGLEIRKPGKLDVKVPDTLKTLKGLKSVLEQCGYDYAELIAENQFDLEHPSRLQQLCRILSENITPRRRKQVLAKAGWNKALQEAMLRKKFGGTASVCEKYMLEAISAFKNGETYGNFQARRLKERECDLPAQVKYKYLPPFVLPNREHPADCYKEYNDADIIKNIVVFKAVNETRKVINALVRQYGSPDYINVEIADELGRSFLERAKITKLQKGNNKKREQIKQKILDLKLRNDETEIREKDISRFMLWEQQDGRDPYSFVVLDDGSIVNKAISAEEILDENKYDVDHIVPFSLVLDDTLQNKVLVNMGANRQEKRQQVPLQYLRGDQKETFLKNVNALFKAGKISVKKYQYLMLPNVYDTELLSEWKSRNINDTRYITRYIVHYLSNNLFFGNENKKKHVYAVKGAITSRMRKMWLNKKSWGAAEKDRSNNLHHAADALVIANLSPAMIEIIGDNMRLHKIYNEHHRKISNEYTEYLEKATKRIAKYYGMSEGYIRKLLGQLEKVPARINRLREEANLRLSDCNLEAYKNLTEDTFKANVINFYRDDPQFAAGLQMPLVSYKQNKKMQGAVTGDEPKKLKEAKSPLGKTDTLGNMNYYDAASYYCVELYETVDGKNNLRGIRYADLRKQNKKLYLTAENPADYKQHKMYLFANDYIEVIDAKGKVKFIGYYKSVHNINTRRLWMNNNNNNSSCDLTISVKDTVKKYNIDILGKIGGEVKCSAPFMLLREKK